MRVFLAILILFGFFIHSTSAKTLDEDSGSSNTDSRDASHFVYLRDVAPSIIQDMRYAGNHNFVGRPISGYEAKECILTREAADTLAEVQAELEQSSLSLKVYDCYRPTRAVKDFMAWSKIPEQQGMKAEFYPRTNKKDFFRLGYVASKSGHSRGSTVDLTIVPIPTPDQPAYVPGQTLVSCYAPYSERYQDNSIDMGTGYDCMDKLANPMNSKIRGKMYLNRMLLRGVMTKHGFQPYEKEWWHFTLKEEPYPDESFDFPIKGS